MKKTVSAMEARKHFGEILEGVHYKGDEVVIERNGKVMGVVIPESRYASIERNRARFWAMLDRIHEGTKDIPTEVIAADVEAAIREVRAQKRRRRTA